MDRSELQRVKTIEVPWRAPLEAFAPLAAEPYAALLHAGEGARDPGRSILVARPVSVLTARGRQTNVDGALRPDGPLSTIRTLLAERPAPAAAAFRTGLVGFIGYEVGALIEPTAEGPPTPYALPDLAFGLYDASLSFDRRARRCFLSSRTDAAADSLMAAVDVGAPLCPAPPSTCIKAPDPRRHRAAVADAVRRIRDGDFFQVNLAQTLQLESDGAIDAFAAFRALSAGDAPFGAYLRGESGAVVSASPERFFRMEPADDGFRVAAEPVKGTRRRGATPETDMALARELCESAKDRAENVMIADLLRNDLARVCEDRSISEDAICLLRSFSTVHHLVSVISGRLRSGLSVVDVIEALFPCGSITGAPKIEAMRAIAALEGRGRGPYCGAIGWIDDGGAADFSVAIRTAIVEGGSAFAPVGGGVTLRSDPDAEYDETIVKAEQILRAFGAASRI